PTIQRRLRYNPSRCIGIPRASKAGGSGASAFGLNRGQGIEIESASHLVAGLFLIFCSAFLTIVVLTPIAEAVYLLPSMGWVYQTAPDITSIFVSAILGCTLLPLSILVRLSRRRRSNKAVR